MIRPVSDIIEFYRLHVITRKKSTRHSETANLRQAAILNLSKDIFRAEINNYFSRISKFDENNRKPQQVEDFQYGGFDLEL